MLITVFSISCKNKPTETATYTFGDDSMTVNASDGFKQFKNKVYRSDAGIDESGTFYLWVNITDNGIQYTQDAAMVKPNFANSKELTLQTTAEKTADKGGAGPYSFIDATTKQQGTATFANGGILKITFSSGTSYDNKGEISCKVLVE